MKNKFCWIVAGLSLALGSMVSAQTFKEKDMVINGGIGAGTSIYSGSAYSTRIPPLSASFEYGVQDGVGPGSIGVGGLVGLAASRYEMSNNFGWDYTYTFIGLRGAYHLTDLAEHLDTYGGLMLGFAVVSSSEFGTNSMGINPSGSFSNLSIYAGARYYLTDKIAAMGEIGTGFSWLNVGIAYKLN